MKQDDLWALFRGWIDSIDAGSMTTSDVRRAMLKLQNEEKNGLEPMALEPSRNELDCSPSNVS